jgi:hypothetical protein
MQDMSQIGVHKDNRNANNLNGLGLTNTTKYSTWNRSDDIMTECGFSLRRMPQFPCFGLRYFKGQKTICPNAQILDSGLGARDFWIGDSRLGGNRQTYDGPGREDPRHACSRQIVRREELALTSQPSALEFATYPKKGGDHMSPLSSLPSRSRRLAPSKRPPRKQTQR